MAVYELESMDCFKAVFELSASAVDTTKLEKSSQLRVLKTQV